MSKKDAIKESAEMYAEVMEKRKNDVLDAHFDLPMRAAVDLGGLGVAGALVYFTDGLVWVLLAVLIGAISAWGLFWKVVASL